MTFFEEMRLLANGELACECGNADWKQFLYVSGGPKQVIAGCKRCGRT